MPKSVFDKPFFQNETAAYAKLESIISPNGPVCVHCGDRARIGLMGARQPALACIVLRLPETVPRHGGDDFRGVARPHAPMDAGHLPHGVVSRAFPPTMHRAMGVALKHAWHLTHRIREAMKTSDSDKLGGYSGTVEADETYVGRREGTEVKKGA